MTFHATVLTLYPEIFPGHLGKSMAGKALACNVWSIDTVQIRHFATNRNNSVDDTPAGGGAGMILKADVLGKAIDHAISKYTQKDIPRILMSPRGQPLKQERVRQISNKSGAIIICGHFEGIDERIVKARDLEEISVGDYILSGGEPAALVLLDAIVRLLPGVLGNKQSTIHESFENGLLEFPQYTKPQIWEGLRIPSVLNSGNHEKIRRWREEQSLALTKKHRPDLLSKKGVSNAQ
ncbi:MAG: tRNA (guanosine(37)-N1)-methyltransferase TrmD [Candidatus Liberibacter solanacearum]|uniref:tRNA (guanosine(37)-N1)-methyltransferase TrmD n=1 Tax=Candidatus Liberibacter solanacearum TaxID=556287 RepID=UPI000978E659|nr:tRNA (guanosine(37)-N1)-methyltransferase TrmD [Candidatus Liberibacter solanacearum]ONI59822.1 tRNA (guanosine(37)-N1)-methyltransferase TrmD [Candidatus Liberibacter solanacearum]